MQTVLTQKTVGSNALCLIFWVQADKWYVSAL